LFFRQWLELYRLCAYQVPLAHAMRREADISTMAVGLIVEAAEAESIVTAGSADLVALAGGALILTGRSMRAMS
jgi:2,4-dienoyl-CoA reductase-like NADH-dependent reductase (Old Yellow Enzyme family)